MQGEFATFLYTHCAHNKASGNNWLQVCDDTFLVRLHPLELTEDKVKGLLLSIVFCR